MLAELLHVEPEVLRYGEGIRNSVKQRRQRWDDGTGYLERETFDAFLQLPPEQRRLIRETILVFARANAEAAATPKAEIAGSEAPGATAAPAGPRPRTPRPG